MKMTMKLLIPKTTKYNKNTEKRKINMMQKDPIKLQKYGSMQYMRI